MPPARRRKVTLVVLMGGMLALAAAGAIGAVVSDDPPVRRATTTTIPTTTTTRARAADFGAVGRELDVLAEAGRHVDYYALYGVTDPALPEGLVQTVEYWRKGDLFRSDVVERQGAGTTRQTYISGGPVLRKCVTDYEGVQTCETVTAVPNDLATEFVEALHEAEDEVELEARDDDVAGFVARCFEAEDIGELCVAGDGVMLRLKLKDATVELTRIDDVVPDTAFDTAG